MKRFLLLTTGIAVLVLAMIHQAEADSIWDRRDPYTSRLFEDKRARRPGDLLTIVVREATLFDGKENRNMKKETKNAAQFNLQGETASDSTSRSFSASMDGATNSQRQFDGKSDYKSDRTFTDRMTVRVVAVEPNGNLVIEGYRLRVVADERRMLRVSGYVRPTDIGPGNTIQSQFVGNFEVTYVGSGPETSYTSNGWLGKIMNFLWPF